MDCPAICYADVFMPIHPFFKSLAVKSNIKTKMNKGTGAGGAMTNVSAQSITLGGSSKEATPGRPVTREHFQSILSRWGNASSWAWWAPKDAAGKEKSGMDALPTEDVLNELNPNVVLVGLNISRQIERPFGNFHPTYSAAQDYKLRYALQNTMFWGAYMTDIIKDFEQKVSGKLMKFLHKNKSFEQENIAKFEEELADLGCVNPILIALGNDSYKILKRNFGDKYRIYKVSHYSAFLTKETLRMQIAAIETELLQLPATQKYPCTVH